MMWDNSDSYSWHNEALSSIIDSLQFSPTFMKYNILAHSKNELMQWRGVRRLSVRLSVRL